jgi:hypothetical protein
MRSKPFRFEKHCPGVHVALSGSFRECLRNGWTEHWPIAHKSQVGFIGETYPVLWAFQHRDEAGGLLKETLLPSNLFGQPPLGQDGGRSLIADNEHATNSIEGYGVVDRSVGLCHENGGAV